MRVVEVWPDQEVKKTWSNSENPLHTGEEECYLISPFGEEAEFCSQGNIKVMLFSYELTSKYINIPSKEDLELFYRYSTQLYAYIPLLCNARLV